jgi:hypothetical protein
MENQNIKENHLKFTIYGYLQPKLVEYGIDHHSAAILRYFAKFRQTKKMVEIIVNNKAYYWVKYDAIVEDFPIFNIKKTQVARKMKKLVDAGLLEHYTLKKKGTFSYYRFGPNYHKLDPDLVTSKSYPCDLKVTTPCDFKVRTNNPCIRINPITKDKIPAKPKFTKEHSDIAIKIANHVLSLNPGDKQLTFHYDKTINRWADEIRKMTDIDKRQIDYIIKVLDFAINDDFWCNNILSGSKLRQKYDTLYVQMQKKQNKNKPKRNIERDGYGYNQAQ